MAFSAQYFGFSIASSLPFSLPFRRCVQANLVLQILSVALFWFFRRLTLG